MCWPLEEGEFNREEAALFQNFREDCGNVVMYISLLLKGRCLSALTELFSAQVTAQQADQLPWQFVEGTLFITKFSAEALCGAASHGAENIPQLLELLAYLPDNALVKCTALSFVGGIGGWLKNHPESLEPLLVQLLDGLVAPAFASEAACALRSICEECSSLLSPALDTLTEHYHHAVRCGLTVEDRKHVVEGIFQVAKRLDPESMCTVAVQVLSLEVERIEQLCQLGDVEQRQLIAGDFEVIGHAFRQFDESTKLPDEVCY